MGSRPAAAGLRGATSSPPFSTLLRSRLGGRGLLLGGSGAGFFFGSAWTRVIQGGSFLGAGVLEGSRERQEPLGGKEQRPLSLDSAASISKGTGEKRRLPPLPPQHGEAGLGRRLKWTDGHIPTGPLEAQRG